MGQLQTSSNKSEKRFFSKLSFCQQRKKRKQFEELALLLQTDEPFSDIQVISNIAKYDKIQYQKDYQKGQEKINNLLQQQKMLKIHLNKVEDEQKIEDVSDKIQVNENEKKNQNNYQKNDNKQDVLQVDKIQHLNKKPKNNQAKFNNYETAYYLFQQAKFTYFQEEFGNFAKFNQCEKLLNEAIQLNPYFYTCYLFIALIQYQILVNKFFVTLKNSPNNNISQLQNSFCGYKNLNQNELKTLIYKNLNKFYDFSKDIDEDHIDYKYLYLLYQDYQAVAQYLEFSLLFLTQVENEESLQKKLKQKYENIISIDNLFLIKEQEMTSLWKFEISSWRKLLSFSQIKISYALITNIVIPSSIRYQNSGHSEKEEEEKIRQILKDQLEQQQNINLESYDSLFQLGNQKLNNTNNKQQQQLNYFYSNTSKDNQIIQEIKLLEKIKDQKQNKANPLQQMYINCLLSKDNTVLGQRYMLELGIELYNEKFYEQAILILQSAESLVDDSQLGSRMAYNQNFSCFASDFMDIQNSLQQTAICKYIAKCYEEIDKYKSSIQYGEKYLANLEKLANEVKSEMKESTLQVLFDLGYAYYVLNKFRNPHRGEHNKMIVYWEQCKNSRFENLKSKFKKEYIQIYKILGEYHWRHGDEDKALQNFEQGMVLNPDIIQSTLFELAQEYKTLHQYEKAEQTYKSYVKLFKENSHGYFELAKLQVKYLDKKWEAIYNTALSNYYFYNNKKKTRGKEWSLKQFQLYKYYILDGVDNDKVSQILQKIVFKQDNILRQKLLIISVMQSKLATQYFRKEINQEIISEFLLQEKYNF
ncbi:hypothetical protein PPERSA_02867 [Pseudocohnilembus persalinus]|uniref:Uncharacterized protein n=1 Tax=Pseudocohnilembus persalinus TaxID=266149 RepID=A0A0V0QNF3_PSEPJ|nr:hypothetical protein PPERSA_02867 [Pseudocohnilembus persalinus]|eukprot:KRX03488.1 hypothetical protein PPERSA_02867 [Pseudocohnilembus persalinus]